MKRFTKNCSVILAIATLLMLTLTVCATDARLYIATNKESFNSSETVQFQVFLINPSSKTNNTVFAELIDCYGNSINKKMLAVTFNSASGSIVLPESASSEYYLLYCYIINDKGIESNSIKKIFITGKKQQSPQSQKTKYTITHFFEGGSFVAESPNNILFHCTDENDQPIAIKGKITDDEKRIYAVFETNNQGLAKIKLNPEDKVRYYVVLKDEDGKEDISPLPVAASTGLTLNASIAGSNIVYNIISYAPADDQLPEYKIEALYNKEVVYDAAISFQKGLSAVQEELKKESLPEGFITFRLVDRSNKILTQRVIYNTPVTATNNFISVIDTVNNMQAIVELPEYVSGKGYINIGSENSATPQKSNLDFLDRSDSSSLSIDDQLISATESPAGYYSPDEPGNKHLSISGILLNSEKKPVKNKKVNLVFLYKNLKKQFLTGTTDNNGKLQVDNLVFFDSVKVYYQLADKTDEKNDVFIDFTVTPSTSIVGVEKPAVLLYCANTLPLTDTSRTTVNTDEKTLAQVVVTSEKEKTESEKYAESYVSGQMKKSNAVRNEYDFIKDPKLIDNTNLFDFIRSRFAGLLIKFSNTGTPYLTAIYGGTVGVYLNDMDLGEQPDLSFLSNLQIKDVALVKYYSMSFKPKVIAGNILTDPKAQDAGDLMIYTKRDYNPSEEKTKGLPKANIVGYDLEKPVIASEHSAGNDESIFWKPDWKVENGQIIYLDLPAEKKEIQITIEGINKYLAPYRFTQKLVFK